MKYSFDSRVGYSEISQKGIMTVGAIIDRFQDCSNFQSDSLGVGIEYLLRVKKVWVLSSWQIVFDKTLKMGDNIKVSTWAYNFDKMFGYRNFMIENEKGDKCACASSRWVLMDTERMRPVRIGLADVEMYGTEQRIEMEYATRKIEIPEHLEEVDKLKVRGYQIDTNGHMNNAWYVKIAMDYQKNEGELRQLRVEYKKSAVLNDIMKVKIFSENDITIVVLCDEDDKIYSVAEFTFQTT